MRQKSIGEVLKDARESRSWTIAEIQRMTKIQAKYVQALEYNDFEAIPDKEYTRSFLHRYAELLELDSSVILDAFDSNRLVVYYDDGNQEDSMLDMRRNVKKKSTKSYLPLIYLLLASIFILIFVAYIVSQRIQNQAIAPKPSSSYSIAAQSSSSSSSTEVTTETSESSTPPSSSEQPTVKLEVSGSGSTLDVKVKGAEKPVEVKLNVTTATSWISLSETELANGTVLSPDNKEVSITLPEGLKNTTLTLGVVNGVEVTVAGQKLNTSALTDQAGYINLAIE